MCRATCLQRDVQRPPRGCARNRVQRFALHPCLQIPQQLRQAAVVLARQRDGAARGVLGYLRGAGGQAGKKALP